MPPQIYEDYWKLTNEYTDYNGKGFLETLRVCIDFIDRYSTEPYTDEKYARLQNELNSKLNKNEISIRKAINQLVKMGFVNSFLVSYHPDAPKYVEARTSRRRQSLLSKIVYSNSSFNRAVNDDSDLHQLNFLINTLIENGKLSVEQIIALMLVDIGSEGKGYLTEGELQQYVTRARESDFISRKYNQISYLTNLLRKLDDIVFVNNELYFTDDAKRLFGEELSENARKRDPYLHLIYKNELKDEVISIRGNATCMVENLDYPILIASHIKPFVRATDEEAYDPENGLLLSRNLDSLFDQGFISFNDDGSIIVSQELSASLRVHLTKYSLSGDFIRDSRRVYMNFHREFFSKRLIGA